MTRLNDTTVRALRIEPDQDRKEVWFDKKGLGMRISKTGRKSWVYVYHYRGKSRRLTLGTYPQMGVADVQAAHALALQSLERGIDPGDTLQAERATARDIPTVEELAREYMTRHACNKKSGAEDQRMLNHDVLPYWKNIKANEITRRDVCLLLNRVVDRGANIVANRVLSLVRKMFNFGIEQSMIEHNPCDRVKPPASARRRERFMSQAEIKKFWDNLDFAKMSDAVKLALKLQLVTAQRKGEVANAEWTEIDFQAKVWTIPASKAKNGHTHRVPLSELALLLFEQLQGFSGGSKFVLPSPKGDQPISGTAINHALWRSLEAIELYDLTPHDLRRTAASMIASLQVPRLVVSKILNHVDDSVTAVYDRHSYDREKRDALNLWANKLQEICASPSTTDALPLAA